MSDSDPYFGISRLDQESVGTHGWQVRFQRKGVRYGRFFSDSAWGGEAAALGKAQKFRDRLLARAERGGAETAASPRSHSSPAARNRSGVVGVTRIMQRSADGTEYYFWQASWTTGEGKRKTIRYSVLKHGNETAFELACIARREALG
ncbi:MAG: AP2 domain-containing protein [Verrucomicrobiales bacterium]|nr:AP2 domain-containing protein [Verrucomicrobiales bacterium]